MAYPVLYLRHADVAVGFDDFDDHGEFKDLRDVADTFRLDPVTLTIDGMKLNMHRGTYASTNLQVRLRKIHEVEPAKGSTAGDPIPLGGMAAAGATPGLNNVQLLRHNPLPDIDYHTASTNRSTSEYKYHPVAVLPLEQLRDNQGVALPLDDAILQHTNRLVPAGSYPVPSASTNLPYYSTEDGPYQAFGSAVMDPINGLLKDDSSSSSSTCCGSVIQNFLWAPHRTSQITDSQDMTQYVSVDNSTKPEFELVHKVTKESRCIIEVKRSEVLDPVGSTDGDLVRAWNEAVNGGQQGGGYSACCKRVVCVLSQAYTYMCERGQKYGAITIYEGSWLLCCVENGTLLVSRRYGRSDSNPTPREAMYMLSHLALQPDAVRQPWQGQKKPGVRDNSGLTRSRSRQLAAPQLFGPSLGVADKTSASSTTTLTGWQQEQSGQGAAGQGAAGQGAAGQGAAFHSKATGDPAEPDAAPTSDQLYGSSKRRVVQLPASLVASTTKPLGSGACGTVYMGWYGLRGAPIEVAIKTALAPGVQELLRNEATTYSYLQAGQGVIVPRLIYHGPGVGDRGYILATQLIHGEALTDDNASPQLCKAALSALRAVHSMGVLHGDLRRSNMLVEGGKVWLIDFSHASSGADTDSMMWEEQVMLDLFKPGWQD